MTQECHNIRSQQKVVDAENLLTIVRHTTFSHISARTRSHVLKAATPAARSIICQFSLMNVFVPLKYSATNLFLPPRQHMQELHVELNVPIEKYPAEPKRLHDLVFISHVVYVKDFFFSVEDDPCEDTKFIQWQFAEKII
jgi:hypothetical protein